MKPRIDITAVEIVDSEFGDDLRAKVERVDEAVVKVEVIGLDSTESWVELAKAVEQCIRLMDGKGSSK